ncbi:TolC family protein [Urbifossiella limnaea]|uniref:Cobalt-zinc-cadmium resistance protein CzcC n=1 Tax=Urbifossiella limnaea TaxID=2528023 RepID=A0A517XV11_9BACT|nr:TolC family protein [Urbifossiella limnaea]QDU21348.1 Cobalt-zinc-cadmium resistance protein CzcC precursor [Urbifossiella limnaea]
MRTRNSTFGRFSAGLALAGTIGCAAGPPPYDPSTVRPYAAPTRQVASPVVPANHQELEDGPVPAAPAAEKVRVDDLVQLALGRNPRLAKATFDIDAAQGKHVQAGLYPNPTLGANWDEIGDRTGPGGILNVPRVTQEIVTGRKLSLSQAVASKEVDQATLALLRERYAVIGTVRGAFYDLYALERRITALDELVGLAGEATKTGQTLLDNKQIARLDLVQLEVELARFRSQAEAARQELPGARKRLAAVVGDPRLAVGAAAGPFDDLPVYDLDQARETVLATHPEVRSARVGVERAQAAVRRAEVEPIPNVTATAGYVKQYENRSNDFSFGLSAPIPTWNRNQGNIRSARAELGAAIQDVGRVENDLAERVAVAHRTYAASLKLAQQYRTDILPKAEETYRLSREAFKGGQFEYLRVIQAQRVVAEARLESVRALGEAWQAAAELSALLLEEWWPGPPPPVPGPGAGPVRLPLPQPDPPRKDGVQPR